MKRKYLVKNLRNNILFVVVLMSSLCVVGVMANESVIETTVFSDDFDRSSLSPGGSPEVVYEVAITGTAVPIIENNSILKLPNVSNENARSQVMADLAGFSSPFDATLNNIEADSLVWRFNIRHNYKGRLTGIDNENSRGVAVVLVASSSDLSAANGYAIVNGGDEPINYRLVKFSGGLTEASNITVLQQGQTLTDNREYMSVKLKYIPLSDTWELSDRVDGPASGGSYADPLTDAGYVLSGSVVDNTHTNSDMSYFGFTHKYSGSITFNFWIDNYSVKAYETDLGTGIKTFGENPSVNWHYIQRGISITALDASVTLYDLTGSVVQTVQVNNQADIQLTAPGMYVMKVQPANGKTSVEKILIR